MIVRSVLLLALLGLLPACSSEGGTDARPAVAIEYPDGGPPLNEHFSFLVDTYGVELVDVDADMPAHGHGINTDPVFVLQEDGRYLVEGMLLHMPGAWELYFDLRTSDGGTNRIKLPLELGFE